MYASIVIAKRHLIYNVSKPCVHNRSAGRWIGDKHFRQVSKALKTQTNTLLKTPPLSKELVLNRWTPVSVKVGQIGVIVVLLPLALCSY